MPTLAYGLGQRFLENPVGRDSDGLRECAAKHAVRHVCRLDQYRLARPSDEIRFTHLVKHVKTGLHARFERKLVQNAVAESVDGLHLQSTRGLDRRGEQASRQRPQCGRWF